jgi:hypothetical protein
VVYVFFVLIEFFSHVGAPNGDSRKAESHKFFCGNRFRGNKRTNRAENSLGCDGVVGTRGAVKAAGAGGRHLLRVLAVLRQLGGARLQRILVYH